MKPGPLTVVHVVDSLALTTGGPARAIVQLGDALAAQPGVRVVIVSISPQGDSAVQHENPLVESVSLNHRSFIGPIPAPQTLGTLQALMGGRQPVVLHSHGLWRPLNHWACAAARRAKRPVVIQSHGMLGALPLARKGLKKRFGLRLYQRGDIERATVVVATAEEEYRQIRQAGFRLPIAIIPIGVPSPGGQAARARPHEHLKEHRTVLYLSRVTRQKGLPELIRAWAKLSPSGWRLRIVGPDVDGFLGEVLALIREVGAQDSIEYAGAAYGSDKAEAFRNADIFILPSEHENFGVAVVEALQAGIPVMTTRATPWSEIEARRCGWWIEFGEESIRTALGGAMALTDEERSQMGVRAQEYAQEFAWETISARTCDLYRWVVGQGPVPECVRME